MKFKKLVISFSLPHTDRVSKLIDTPEVKRLLNGRELNKIKNLYNNRFDNKVSKYPIMNYYYKSKSNSDNDTSRNITPLIEERVRKEGGTVTHYGNDSNFGWDDNGHYGINVSPNSDDSSASHELQHLINFKRGEYPQDKYDESNKKFKNQNEFFKSIRNKNDILDYIHNVSREEQRANRGRVMNTYLYGGDKVNDKMLDRFQKRSDIDQKTYDSLIGGYSVNPVNHNMDKSLFDKLQKRNKS